MASVYQLAEQDIRQVVDEAMDTWHQRLRDVKVRLAVLVAQNLDGPAVRHNGYPALGTIRVVSAKDRITKDVDAELLIDEREWNGMKPAHRLAFCDHELTHLVVVRNRKTGEVKYDDRGRPKLRCRKGDWNGGDGFREVVERHGDFAVEFLNARRAFTLAQAAAAHKPSLMDGLNGTPPTDPDPELEPPANPAPKRRGRPPGSGKPGRKKTGATR